MTDAALESAQLGEPPHPSKEGVARVGALAQVVEHLMAMIRAHRQRPPLPSGEVDHGGHNGRHVGVAFKMCRFMEAIARLSTHRAEMEKADPAPEPIDHSRQIIVGPLAERARAQANTVRSIGDLRDQRCQIGLCADHTRQAEQGKGWSVGVNDQAYTGLISCRAARR